MSRLIVEYAEFSVAAYSLKIMYIDRPKTISIQRNLSGELSSDFKQYTRAAIMIPRAIKKMIIHMFSILLILFLILS